jgi:hypothetical protein
MDQTLRMGSDAQQHVLEVREGREVDQFTALHERIEEGGAARAFEAAREEPVLATQRDDAELVLGTGMPPARLCRVGESDCRCVRDLGYVSLERAA